MANAISRAQFLHGDFSGRSRPLRPPWSVPENAFVERCTRCGDCMTACPQHILAAGRAGFPQVDFSAGECLFCGDCVRSCKSGALVGRTEPGNGVPPWTIRARIGARCLARGGVECRSCADHCAAAAISFRLVAGGVAQPRLDTAACNGCGACYATCPVQAIELGEHDT